MRLLVVADVPGAVRGHRSCVGRPVHHGSSDGAGGRRRTSWPLHVGCVRGLDPQGTSLLQLNGHRSAGRRRRRETSGGILTGQNGRAHGGIRHSQQDTVAVHRAEFLGIRRRGLLADGNLLLSRIRTLVPALHFHPDVTRQFFASHARGCYLATVLRSRVIVRYHLLERTGHAIRTADAACPVAVRVESRIAVVVVIVVVVRRCRCIVVVIAASTTRRA